ncbi:MAG: hypothetical protein LBQ66_08580, partial [Planctomycetaceae bacterium]|nr:hypothetical protein [Planctomycetaceae bacterium]
PPKPPLQSISRILQILAHSTNFHKPDQYQKKMCGIARGKPPSLTRLVWYNEGVAIRYDIFAFRGVDATY